MRLRDDVLDQLLLIVDPGQTGAARADEQRADSRCWVGRDLFDDRQWECRRVRAGPVDREIERGAAHASVVKMRGHGFQTIGAARQPLGPLPFAGLGSAPAGLAMGASNAITTAPTPTAARMAFGMKDNSIRRWDELPQFEHEASSTRMDRRRFQGDLRGTPDGIRRYVWRTSLRVQLARGGSGRATLLDPPSRTAVAGVGSNK
ncbi:hypothetical protein AB0J84_31600 [Micromonospora arborensis]|uniref:hypothetical protein n=1 Tax=Micromonospora arborensis TaxID=2116518 RepID=UPI003413A37F